MEATDGQVNLNVVDIIENEDTVEKAIILLEDYVGRNPEVEVIFFVGAGLLCSQ